jgi:Rrf2 family protein
MSASTKLYTAVRSLVHLAETHPVPQSSAQISEVTGIHSSKIRKILSFMVKGNLVSSEKGNNGGFILNKAPKQITLQEIYCDIEDRKAFHLDVSQKYKKSKETEDFNKYFLGLFSDIQIQIESKMSKITLADILKNFNKTTSFKKNKE